MKKNLLIMGIVFVASIAITYATIHAQGNDNNHEVFSLVDTATSIFQQEVVATSKKPVEITKLYREGKLIGIINDKELLDRLFNQVYEEEYKDEFPDSKLGFVDDLFQAKELSYNRYEDKDNEIFEYLKAEDLFAIEVNKIEFSNGAIIYVKDVADFNAARETFIKNFISDDTFDKLKNEIEIPKLVSYGVRDIGFEVEESIKSSRGLASKDSIYTNEGEIIQFLNYGYNPEILEYHVEPGDTVQGIAYLHGMSANQLIAINREVLESENQIIGEGIVLKVSRMDKSPFTVRVTQERLVSEPTYPAETIYENDPTMLEGTRKEVVKEEYGTRDAYYEEVIQNGEIISSVETASQQVKEPVRGKVLVGTRVEPKVGSGIFRAPMNNYYVMCGWFCYGNHRGVDFAARNGKYGPIYAIDRGVVVQNTYGGGWGYYIKIDHGNGYQSLYAHMASPGYFGVGQTVGKGDNIGYVGMTGRTTAPHVHLEVYRSGTKINACTVISC